MNKKVISTSLIVLFAISVFVISLFFPGVTKADVPVREQPGRLLDADINTEKSTRELEKKETGLGGGLSSLLGPLKNDKLAWLAANIAIDGFTKSVVNWINSGFQGGPAFVTDLKGFLLDIADAETSLFIEGTALEALCSPWKLDIKVALALKQATPFEREIRCTLSDIVANMDDFINGDFSQGGWAGWFELTTRPQNNPYGLYLITASELDQRIAGTQQERTTLLDWGNGFFSQKKCETVQAAGPVQPGAPVPVQEVCEIVTPGSVVEEKLNSVLFSGVRKLEVADEVDEILTAALNQLFNQFLSGGRGLIGLNEGSYGRPSAINNLGTYDPETVEDIKDKFINSIDTEIENENDYRGVKQSTLNAVIASENLLFSLQACYAGKLGGNLSSGNKSIAQQRINDAVTTIADKITPTKTTLEEDIAASDQNLTKLAEIREDVSKASSFDQLDGPDKDFTELMQSNLLNGSYTSISFAQQEQTTITAQMSSLDSTTNSQITTCQNFPPPLPQQNP